MSNEKFKTVKWVLKGIRMIGNLKLVKKAKKDERKKADYPVG
jgi:hypothetical protein